jgi:YidC/Oxa1 family membrane protein insertase
MENKNLVIALLLMLVVWLGFNVLFPPPKPQTVQPPPRQEQKAAPAAVVTKTPAESPSAVAARVPALLVKTAEKERDITIDTDLYRAVFTNSGGRLKSFELKKYTVSASPKSPQVSLLKVGSDSEASLRSTGTGSFSLPADLLFETSVETPEIHLKGGETRQVVFSASTANVTIQKIYTFHGDGYPIELDVKVNNRTAEVEQGTLQLALVHPWDESMKGGRYAFVGPATLAGDKVETVKVADLEKESKSYGSDLVWTAFENKYFMSAVIPMKGAAEKLQVTKTDNLVENVLTTPSSSLQGGQTLSFRYQLYFGPRDFGILKKVDHNLAKAIDFGFFSPIARPLLFVLKFFYSFVGNYGLAIILLTVIIKALFWPLTQKSYTSMKAMQKLQPEMQKLRERFKNDRDRMNREVMELYKKNRVNPLGGCLPMVVQIPVFFALYRVLLSSIELRHAPFVFWLTDLSAKDPYYITPLIMGGTMFIQQKMTPSSMDPKQAKLFMLMPVVFTFLFLNFPSGLVIYWLVNNLLTILQQYFINKKVHA